MRLRDLRLEMYEYPSQPDPERQEKLKAILRILDKNPRFQPFRDRLWIFGGVARGNPDAGDLDLMLDYSDLSFEAATRLPDIDLFLTLSRQYYGLVDVFIQTERSMAVRDEYANGWDVAKRARALRKAVRTEGKSLDDVLRSWPVQTSRRP